MNLPAVFFEGVLWIAQSGAPWHLLPLKYGKWKPVTKRFLVGKTGCFRVPFHSFHSFKLTGGQAADISQAQALIQEAPGAEADLADNAYDADKFLDFLNQKAIFIGIPSKKTEKNREIMTNIELKRDIYLNSFLRKSNALGLSSLVLTNSLGGFLLFYTSFQL